MKRHYKKIFNSPEKLDELLKLRREGWSFPRLARRYKCDHTSILYQCKKMGVKPFVKVQRDRPLCLVCKKMVATFWNKYCSRKCMAIRNKHKENFPPEKPVLKEGKEKINEGKSYAEYLMISARKKSKVDARLW